MINFFIYLGVEIFRKKRKIKIKKNYINLFINKKIFVFFLKINKKIKLINTFQIARTTTIKRICKNKMF